MRRQKLLVASVIGALALGVVPVYAHGFGDRYDLPVPLNLFLVGAGATVALSFVVIGLFVRVRQSSFRYPTYDLLGQRPIAAVLGNRGLLLAVKAIFLALFALVVATALFGENRPLDNLAPAFVWIIWWVGMGYLTALLGNVWMLINPWKIAFEWGDALLGGSRRGEWGGLSQYPERWDVWPALVLFFIFAWLENVYAGSSQPFKLGLLIMLYSAITWGGMLLFGKHQWLRHGEAFSVLFGFFARFSPTEVAVTDAAVCRGCGQECDGAEEGCVDCYECFERAARGHRRLNVRPYAVGLARRPKVSTATALFVVLALATVTFDGLTATPTWVDFQTSVYSTLDRLGGNTVQVIDTLGLLMLPLVFLTVFVAFSWAIRGLSGEEMPVRDVAKTFVLSLVPIALAYNLAHFVSLIMIQGQLIIPLASDPFGFGWDLFGSAGYRLNIGVVNAKFVWYLSVVAIILGHIISVYVAHVIALTRSSDSAGALRGQYPMLVLMVGYTATSLWIIAQPIVAGA